MGLERGVSRNSTVPSDDRRNNLAEYASAAANATGVNVRELDPFVSSAVQPIKTALATNDDDDGDDDDDDRNSICEHLRQLERDALHDLEKFKNTIIIKCCDKQPNVFVLACRHMDMESTWAYIDSVGSAYQLDPRPEAAIAKEIA